MAANLGVLHQKQEDSDPNQSNCHTITNTSRGIFLTRADSNQPVINKAFPNDRYQPSKQRSKKQMVPTKSNQLSKINTRLQSSDYSQQSLGPCAISASVPSIVTDAPGNICGSNYDQNISSANIQNSLNNNLRGL